MLAICFIYCCAWRTIVCLNTLFMALLSLSIDCSVVVVLGQRPEFGSRPFHVGLAVDKVTLRQVFL